MYKLKFIDVGKELYESKIVKIYKNKGDDIKEGQSIFLVEINKKTLNITSPVSGKIVEVLVKLDDTIYGNEVICHIDDGSTNDEKRILATPLARKLAAKNGINIYDVIGSGPNGRILIKDVESFDLQTFATSNTVLEAAPITTNQDQKIPILGMRKAIAKAMKNSWNNVAYTNLTSEVNMTKLWDQRKEINVSLERTHNIKVTFTTFIAKATILALQEFPMFNAKVDEANNEIIQLGTINLGIAVDTPKGLVVPVIKNANHMSIVQLAQKISILSKKARDGKLSTSDMSSGTFTLSNYGSAGSMFGVPVINYPEIGILGMGIISDRVFGNEKGEFYNGKVMYLTTAADHRWVDGGDIGRFTSRVKEILEKPILMGVL